MEDVKTRCFSHIASRYQYATTALILAAAFVVFSKLSGSNPTLTPNINVETSARGVAPASSVDTPAQRARHAMECWSRSGAWTRDEARARVARYSFRDPLGNGNATWQWVPTSSRLDCPPFLPWSAAGFCAALRGRDVALIGDSLAQQQWNVLSMLMHSDNDGQALIARMLEQRHRTHRLGEYRPETKYSRVICRDEGETTLRLVISPKLQLNSSYTHEGQLSFSGMNDYFTEAALQKPPFGVHVLNAGLHVPDRAALLLAVRSALTTAMRTLGNTPSLLIWRNTPVGHPKCDQFERPLTTPLPWSSYKSTRYRWEDIYNNNAIVSDLLEREFPDVILLDVLLPTMLRPERGVARDTDCLHYDVSKPNPIVHWNLVLYNLLVLLNR